MRTQRLSALVVLLAAALAACLAAEPCAAGDPPRFALLAFSKTAAFRHANQIDAAKIVLAELASEHDFSLETSEDAADFNAGNLARFDVVAFLYTSGDVLDAGQQTAFEAWVLAGGGFAGIHSAADTEYDWPFYGELVGAWFLQHPTPQTGTLEVVESDHPSTAGLPAQLAHFEEWYDFRTNPSQNPAIEILLTVDEASYQGGTMGDPHPIAWHRAMGAGRAWYTALGHTFESVEDYEGSFFRDHLHGGIESVVLPEPGPGLGGLAAGLALALLARRRAQTASSSLPV